MSADAARNAGLEQRIDAHLHLWHMAPGRYSWIGDANPGLARSFGAAEAHAELAASGFDGAILVQAEDSAADTDFMLAVAADNPWVRAVVGWVRLDDPDAVRADLERRTSDGVFRGVRHLVHDDPRDDFLRRPSVRESLKVVADAGLAFDIPNAWPRHLKDAGRLAADLPELSIVIDHLAKPPRESPEFAAWERELRQVAARPNTVAKFSGLAESGLPFTPDALRAVWEIALDAFGPNRLMYGGDWPITVEHGGYQHTWEVLHSLIDELSTPEQTEVLGGTASRVYRLT